MAPDGSRALLLSTAARVRGPLTALVALMVTRALLGLATPTLLAASVKAALDAGSAVRPVALLGAAVALSGLLDATTAPLGASAVGRAGAWLQTHTVGHLLTFGHRSTLPPGDATARVVQAAPGTAGLMVTVAGSVISLASSVVALGLLWWIDPWAGLVFTLAVPAVVLVSRRFIGGATTAQAGYLEAQSAISARLMSALAGARTIRAAGTVGAETDRVLAPLPGLSAAGQALWNLQRGTVWQLKLLIPLTQVVVLAVAGLGVASGRTGPAELLAVTGYLGMASGALAQIDVLLEIAQVRAGTTRLAEILARPGPVDGTRQGLPAGPGEVELREVTVTRDGVPVLDRLDLRLPAGRSIALVGRSGTGKSVVAGLIGRLSDPDGGQVLLDGVPVDELPLTELGRQVSYAFDRPALTGATVHEAIAYGGPGLDHADVVEAARTAHADAFVRRLPHGYCTALADAPMSGGERQRIGLARALVRPARVYVLDDATSGLDTVTEAEVTEALTTRLHGRTRLIVAHRAATAARCDLVAWLDGGRIVALAPHTELWRDDGYRAVFAETGMAMGTGRETAPETETGTPVPTPTPTPTPTLTSPPTPAHDEQETADV
ncbi:ABC transporter ATP-binding protein [Streptomyces liangshanensis]|uniref:ABC transporter ATP-binding protein n=1 Tax=Streptomyces liangshanensis TaxID=2717324 RepID=UPI0036D94C48